MTRADTLEPTTTYLVPRSPVLHATTPAEAAGILHELQVRASKTNDYVVPLRAVRVLDIDRDSFRNRLRVRVFGIEGEPPRQRFRYGRWDLNRTAFTQLAQKLSVPIPYLDRCLGAGKPDLVGQNLNEWLESADGNVTLRTIDDVARSVVSDRYRALDSHDLAFRALQIAKTVGAEISRVDLSDDSFQMRLIVPTWREDVRTMKSERVGAFVPGVVLSNSETGRGGLVARLFTLDLVCTNGMISERGKAVIHVGGRSELGEIISDETRIKRDALTWSEIEDVIRAAFDRERFRKFVRAASLGASLELREPELVIDTVVRDLELTDLDRDAILTELLQPSSREGAESFGVRVHPGWTLFGLTSAITHRAKVYSDDLDRRWNLEESATRLLIEPPANLLRV